MKQKPTTKTNMISMSYVATLLPPEPPLTLKQQQKQKTKQQTNKNKNTHTQTHKPPTETLKVRQRNFEIITQQPT